MPFVRRLRSSPPRLGALVAVTVAVMFALIAGAAASSSSGGVIQACVAKSGGAVRFVSTHGRCKSNESSVLFNRTGPQGPKGKKGPAGRSVVGATGATGVAGPTGPANTEVVPGPAVNLSGAEPTGSTAVSTAGCDHAVNGANHEAYGGGVIVTPHQGQPVPDIIPIQASYPGDGVTGTSQASAPASGAGANAWTGIAVISRMFTGDSATVQAYVICGP
jgi:hypothetical protein